MAENLPETLKALQEQRKLLEQEFSLAKNDPFKLRETTQNAIYELGPQAVETLGALMATSDSDTTRGKIAMFVVSSILDGKSGADAESAMAKLLGKLQPAEA